MLRIIKIIIGAGSAGLATGIGTEIITNPAYSVAILDKVLGTGSKIVLMIPLIGAIYMAMKERKVEKEETKAEKKVRGIKDITWSMVLMIMDLCYASIVYVKENIKGIIMDKGWLKITKTTTAEEKESYLKELVSDYPTTGEIYKDMNVNNYSTKLEIVEELERRLRIPVEEKGILESIALSETTTGYIKIGLLVIGILGIVYIVMNKNKVYDYMIHLGETAVEVIKTQREFAKAAITLLENDEKFAGLLQKVQHEIIECKASTLSPKLVTELQEALILIGKSAEMLAKYGERLDILEGDHLESAKIIEEILRTTANVSSQGV